MREKIINQQYDEERALYHLQHADLEKCSFAGPADGESSLKEARDIGLKGCQVKKLKYNGVNFIGGVLTIQKAQNRIRLRLQQKQEI